MLAQYKLKANLEGKLNPLQDLFNKVQCKTIEVLIPENYVLGTHIRFQTDEFLERQLIHGITVLAPTPRAVNAGNPVPGHQDIVTPGNRTYYWNENCYLTIWNKQNVTIDQLNVKTITESTTSPFLSGNFVPFFLDLSKSYIEFRGNGQPNDLQNPTPANPTNPNANGRAMLFNFYYIPEDVMAEHNNRKH